MNVSAEDAVSCRQDADESRNSVAGTIDAPLWENNPEHLQLVTAEQGGREKAFRVPERPQSGFQ